MLLSNGLHRLKIRLKKFSFSLKIVPAYIFKKLPSQCWPKPLFIAFFNFSHKRPTFAFTSESGYTLGFRRKIAHSGSHAETGAFRTGVVSLPSDRSARSQTSPGRVSERHTLPLLGLGRGCSQRTQGASGQRCAYACRCSEASRPRWAALLCLQFGDVAVFSLCVQYFLNVQGGRALSLPSERFTRFGNPAWPGVRTAYFAAFGAWSGVLPKNAESLRDSDALMRVAVPKASRPRWAAHTYAVNTSIFPAEFFSHSQKAGKKSHSLMFHIHVFDCTA